MYRSFFNGNIFAEIEFIVLTIFFIWLMYKNAHKINVFYASKFNKGIKFLILVLTIILNALIYIILKVYNVHWVISIAINTFFIDLIIMLTISLFSWKDKNL